MKLTNRAKGCLAGYWTLSDDSAKQSITAIVAYAAQNPGLEYGNYASGWNDKEGRAAYFAESRQITKDWHSVCDTVRGLYNVTEADILEASRGAFSGRLQVTREGEKIKIEYCTGQYWPTEYRKACAAVLKQAGLIAYRRNLQECADNNEKAAA